jgi:transposase
MPGPSPLYRPTFTVEQLAQVELIAHQRQAPHAQVQRAQLAFLLHQQPDLDNASLAKQLGHHANWVYKWRKRWTEEGFCLEDKQGRGRKPLFSPSGAQLGQSHRL